MPAPAASKLARDRAALVVVDVQERLHAAMSDKEEVARNVERLVRGAVLLGVPVLATEQYPKGLGRTIPNVAAAYPAPPVEKTAFSCMGEPAFARRFAEAARSQVVLAGEESHVCVLQTGLDLLARGASVFVVEDAVASRTSANRAAGVRRLVEAGAVAVTTEMALFELLGGASDPKFRDVQALVK